MAGYMQAPYLPAEITLSKFYCINITNLTFSYFIFLKSNLICMLMMSFFHCGGAPPAPSPPQPSPALPAPLALIKIEI